MSDETIIVCKRCYDAGDGMHELVRIAGESPVAWTWNCPNCGEQAGVFFDCGEIDLGLVRAETEPNPDFEIFP